MRVSFTKTDAKRYTVTIERQRGPALVPRFAPGYDELMPHDLAHYLVEAYFEIELGVWGQLAAGGGGIFAPAPDDNSLRYQRAVQRIGSVGRSDMQLSERLVVLTVATWEQSIGRVEQHTAPMHVAVDADTLRGAVERMDAVAGRWQALPHSGSLDFVWPAALTFDPAKSQRGRRQRSLATSRH